MRIVRTNMAKLLAVAGLLALLAGCAGAPVATTSDDVDSAKVAMIERAARSYGTQVIWVNYPRKRVATQ